MGPLIVYLHIHKAGGTSLNQLLWETFPEANTFRIDGTRPAPSYAELVTKAQDPEFRKHIKLITGHQLYGVHSYFKERRTEYITVLRNPVDRTVSLFNFLFHSKAHPLAGAFDKGDFKAFLNDKRIMALDNGMTRMLSGARLNEGHFNGFPFGEVKPWMLDAAKDHIRTKIHVGFTEYMNESTYYFSRILNIKNENRIRHSNRSSKVVSVSDLDLEAQELVCLRNRYDNELYEFAKRTHLSKILDAYKKKRLFNVG